MYIPHFVYHSSVDKHLGCFHFLSILSNAVITLVYKYLFEFLFPIPLGIIPKHGIAGSNILQNSKTFGMYCIPRKCTKLYSCERKIHVHSFISYFSWCYHVFKILTTLISFSLFNLDLWFLPLDSFLLVEPLSPSCL